MLFEVRNGKLAVTEFALLTDPFMTIWNYDNTERHEKAMQLFRYVELLCSPRKGNAFYGYSKEDRPKKVKKEVYGDADYPDTDFMMQCVFAYTEFLKTYSPTYELLESAIDAADEVKKFLKSGKNLQERTRGGTAVYKPRDVIAAIEKVDEVSRKVLILRDKVHFELETESKTRNQRKIGQYER